MEDRIKQRLTGAVIVVALMVLAVPEMFHGRPALAPQPAGAAAGGPPVRSYTIELRDGAAPASTGSAATAASSDQPALAAPPKTVTATVSTAPAAGESQGAVTDSSQTAPAAPGAAAPAAVTVAPAQPNSPPAASSAPQSAPAPAPAAAASGANASRYQVQLGLFASRANADRLAASVYRKGIKVAVSGPDAHGLYRVHTATYATHDAAQSVQQKLRELGLSAALTPQR
jgi:cell division protein FtsN